MDIQTEALIRGLENAIAQLQDRVSDLTDELSIARHELDRQITEERYDRERGDDSIRSELSNLEHKVDYL